MTLSPYKLAKLYRGEKEWFVYYSYLNPITYKFERFKERFDINRYENLSEKKSYANEAVKFINQKLASGFNPFAAIKHDDLELNGAVLQQLNTIIKIASIGASEHQARTYQTMKFRFEHFINAKQIQAFSMIRFDVDVAREFKNYMIIDMLLSSKTINATLSHIAMFWDIAIEQKLTVSNPFRNVEKAKKQRSADGVDVYEPLTSQEVDLMFSFLNSNNQRNYVRFLAMIYCAWARPVEICRLKIKNIDLDNDLIQFRKGETKNDKGAFVQIIPPLKKLFIEMKLHTYTNKEMYIFSTEDYMPGFKQKDPECALEKWNWWIVKKCGIKKKMYALKHTGNIEYLIKNRGNVDLKWQQMQNRHSSAEITQRYNRKLGAYFIETKDLKFREI